nr:hypothetical protein GCM10020093_060300 [Planobispora longispora]
MNSPSNPTGRVLPAEHLRKVVSWARERGAIVASDECYIELGWEEQPISILHPDVCGGSHEGLLAVHSLSKRSNLAGYRAGFVAGDSALIRRLLEVRKHAGMIVPAPVQAAMAAALDDDAHADEQRARYAARREALRPALEAAGWRIEHSAAGLYLWASNGEGCWDQVRTLAEKGILVAPGDFYGEAGSGTSASPSRPVTNASMRRCAASSRIPLHDPCGRRDTRTERDHRDPAAWRVLRDHAPGPQDARGRVSRRDPPPAEAVRRSPPPPRPTRAMSGSTIPTRARSRSATPSTARGA